MFVEAVERLRGMPNLSGMNDEERLVLALVLDFSVIPLFSGK